MLNLFKTEFLQYRNRALLAALVHMALLGFAHLSEANVHATPGFPLWWMASMVASAGFGILQMNAHKRTNHWIHLMQRPLAPWKIGTAIAGAGCALVTIALVLPFVLNIARLELVPAAGVELRHYLQLGQVVPALLLIYVYAAFSTLYTHKLRFIGLTVFIGVLMNVVGVNTYAMLLALACIIAVCFYMWFKPDLHGGAAQPLFIVMSELPLHFGLFWAGVFVLAAIHAATDLVAGAAPPDSVAGLQQKDGREVMLAALEHAAPADAEFYRRQLAVGEVVTVTPRSGRSFAERNQRPSLDGALEMTDPETNASWRFSHSAMLFKGVDPRSDATLGWLGPQGFITDPQADSARFASVPWVTQNRFILDDTTIYQLDWEQRALRAKFILAGLEPVTPEPERFSDSLGIHPNFATLTSNYNLYLFRSRQLDDFNETLVLETRLPYPIPGAQTSMFVMELIDGYLVAQLARVAPDTGEGHYQAFEPGRLTLYATGPRGNTLLSDRVLDSGVGAADIYEGFVVAPGFRLLNALVVRVVLNWDTERALPLLYHPFPPLVLLLALGSMLVSAIIVARLLRPIALPRAAKVTWVALCAFSGLLGLASFYFGTWRGGLNMQVKAGGSRTLPSRSMEVGRA